jgi:hypothetical protein
MSDAQAQRALRCNDARGQSAPTGGPPTPSGSTVVSSYPPSHDPGNSVSYTSTVTSRALSARQPSPSAVLLAAHELLCYQPIDTGRDEWLARVAELIAITHITPPSQGGAHSAPGRCARKRGMSRRTTSSVSSFSRGPSTPKRATIGEDSFT